MGIASLTIFPHTRACPNGEFFRYETKSTTVGAQVRAKPYRTVRVTDSRPISENALFISTTEIWNAREAGRLLSITYPPAFRFALSSPPSGTFDEPKVELVDAINPRAFPAFGKHGGAGEKLLTSGSLRVTHIYSFPCRGRAKPWRMDGIRADLLSARPRIRGATRSFLSAAFSAVAGALISVNGTDSDEEGYHFVLSEPWGRQRPEGGFRQARLDDSGISVSQQIAAQPRKEDEALWVLAYYSLSCGFHKMGERDYRAKLWGCLWEDLIVPSATPRLLERRTLQCTPLEQWKDWLSLFPLSSRVTRCLPATYGLRRLVYTHQIGPLDFPDISKMSGPRNAKALNTMCRTLEEHLCDWYSSGLWCQLAKRYIVLPPI
jgi:hypothetical protein